MRLARAAGTAKGTVRDCSAIPPGLVLPAPALAPAAPPVPLAPPAPPGPEPGAPPASVSARPPAPPPSAPAPCVSFRTICRFLHFIKPSARSKIKAMPARPPRTLPAMRPPEGSSEESPESLSSAAGLEGEAGSPAPPPPLPPLLDASGLLVMMLASELVDVVPKVVVAGVLLSDDSSTLGDGLRKVSDKTLLGCELGESVAEKIVGELVLVLVSVSVLMSGVDKTIFAESVRHITTLCSGDEGRAEGMHRYSLSVELVTLGKVGKAEPGDEGAGVMGE